MLAANRSLCVKFGVIEMQPHAGLCEKIHMDMVC